MWAALALEGLGMGANMLQQNLINRRWNRRWNNYLDAVQAEGLDNPVTMDYGKALGLAKLTSEDQRQGMLGQTANQMALLNRHAAALGLSPAAVMPQATGMLSSVYNNMASQLARSTYNYANQDYQTALKQRDDRLGWLKTRYLSGPAPTGGAWGTAANLFDLASQSMGAWDQMATARKDSSDTVSLMKSLANGTQDQWTETPYMGSDKWLNRNIFSRIRF